MEGRVAGAAGQPAPLGLSSAHIGTRQGGKALVAEGGTYLELGLVRGKEERKGGGKRGRIGAFSRQSRFRLFQLFWKIDRRKVWGVPLFVSLTYPGGTRAHWLPFAHDHKKHLRAFIRRLERFSPDVWLIWRLEPQERGAPHYHLLVFNVAHIPHELVARWWWEIVGSGDEAHLRAGTEVRGCRSWNEAAFYIAKYLGKLPDTTSESPGVVCPHCGQDSLDKSCPHCGQAGVLAALWEHPGRWWGVVHRDRAPIKLESWDLEADQYYRMRRIARTLARKRKHRLRMLDTTRTVMAAETANRVLSWLGARRA